MTVRHVSEQVSGMSPGFTWNTITEALPALEQQLEVLLKSQTME
jgi:uncharacterized protein with HEPN domain